MASQALVAPAEDTSGSAEMFMPTVLVIDDDPQSIGHCTAMLDELGYPHHRAATTREALEHIGRDPTIQIVVADMQMPKVDGFVLIEEARTRMGNGRTLATIMLTKQTTAELAIKGLHIEAVDLLCKPLDFTTYSTALRRAMRYLAAHRTSAESMSMAAFSQQLARLTAMLESKTGEPVPESKLTDKEIGATLRTITASRRLRNRFFSGRLFADPAWDILLDLTRARLDGQQVSVSSVCIAASVPMSTALRWVRHMTDAGLLSRWTDPRDRRRDLIALTEATAAQMRDYLASVHAMIRKI